MYHGLFPDSCLNKGSLYLSRVTGGPISEGEARDVLSLYGEIEKVWYASPTEVEIFRLPEGIWVMYKLFQPSRDAQAVSTQHFSLCILLTSLGVSRSFSLSIGTAADG